MIANGIFLTTPYQIPKKSFIEVVEEICKKTEPTPFFCELPEDLKLKTIETSGTVQTYTYATSYASTASGYSSSTTTTTS